MKLNEKDKHNFMKCIEELTELSLELLHAVNKPNKENMGKICDEIKDVEKYLNQIKIICNEQF
jgi:NTP pyrophosphatase (non-canonical NTP hydrolase)